MKPLVCIFAHPDDEAFGPGGTIAKFAQERDVYLICATKGEAGEYRGKRGAKALGNIRALELKRAAKILGVKEVFFLGFKDGALSNNLYHDIARKIERILKKIKPDTLLTYEPRGVSGHIDHITMAMVSNYVFERLPFVKKLLQFCRLETPKRRKWKYFIYVPPGYKKSDIKYVSNVTGTWQKKLEALKQHESQIGDIKGLLEMYEKSPKAEYFLVREK
ncbi:PIG-L family deacetylase [Candidatus Kaiserbacteria bacterium]|nr:PIG-L family deacetylase [Candidatus Kaiserbacteria bacterium]